MKKTMILAAFAALVSLASCQKEDVIDNKGTDKNASPVFTASIAGATKTTIDLTNGKVAWEESDEITITDALSKSAVYKIESIDATIGKATFAIKSGETALGDGPYTATYGTVPATAQTYSATAGKLYMTAATEDNSFTFDVQCGLMKLNLTSPDESVKSIAVSNSTATYTLTCDPAQSIATAKDFCIALPAGSYTKIEITNAEDITCTLNSTNGVAVAANHIKPVTFGRDKLNFAPVTTGTAKATIGGSEVDVNWIQLWEGGPKFAEYNVGTTSENKYGAYFEWTENIASTEWGDNWRMPTADEYQALLDECHFNSGEINGVKGYLFTGKEGSAYESNRVFFPAGGSSDGLGGLNDTGSYWASTPSSDNGKAKLLYFQLFNSYYLVDGDWCTNRYNVRAVLNEAPAVPDGALPGVFSVSADKQVYFSQGNLYYDGSAFKFEDSQTGFASEWNPDYVSHFFWSKTASVAYAELYSDSGTDEYDVFFTNATDETANPDFTVNGVTGQYRTLSDDEWKYLFDNNSYKWVTINGVGGYAIAPDNVTLPEEKMSYTETELNDAKLVFLPAAGLRIDSDIDPIPIGSFGIYWSSYATGPTTARFVFFDKAGFAIEGDDRLGGLSVRLVTDVK